MAAYNVRLTKQALDDVEDLLHGRTRYAGLKAAEKVMDMITKGLALLQDHPKAGAVHPDKFLSRQGFRKLIIGGEFVAVYTLEPNNEVHVHGIFHGATDYPELFK